MTRPLTHLEAIIESHRSNFYQAGKALMQIHDVALYRDLLFDSFGEYVKTRWDMSKSQAYRLIDASKIIDNLSPIGDGVIPANEAQARVLSCLNEFDQRRIWREFISSGMALSAYNIREFIKRNMQKASNTHQAQPNLIDIISAGYKEAVMAMLYQIRLSHNDNWQQTSKQAGLYWSRVMKERIVYEK